MSVIINELEVITAPEPPATGASASRPQRPAPSGPTPFELRAVLRHLADRVERARAD